MRATIKVEDYAKESESIAEYEDKSINIIAKLQKRLSNIKNAYNSDRDSSTKDSQTHRASVAKLPKLNLATFSGNCKDWMPFWEQFRTAIHENSFLTNADKFNYLRSALTGKAADVISGFTPTASCYDAAVGLLKEEYGNPEKLIDKHLNELLSSSPIHSKSDGEGMRRLHNTVMSCIRSLGSLGVSSDQYSIMLKAVVLKCLPKELQIEYLRFQQDHGSPAGIPSGTQEIEDDSPSTINNNDSTSTIGSDNRISLLLKFLKREINSLEVLAEKTQNRPSSSKRVNGTATGLFTTSASNVCIFCNSNRHSVLNCDSKLTLGQKKEILKRKRMCFRCIKPGHNSKDCRSRQLSCNECKGRHVTIMCDPEYFKIKQGKAQSVVAHKPDPQSTTLCAHSEENITKVYLQTARAFITSMQGDAYVRVVLDGGSQLTFIKESIAKKLNLPIVGVNKLRIISFGCDNLSSPKLYDRVRVSIHGQYSKKLVVIEAVVVPEICVDVLPAPDTYTPYLEKFELADVCLQKSPKEEGISLLIGADNYWRIVSGEIDRITNDLTAVKTVLGWTIQGPVPLTSSVSTTGVIATSTVLVFTLVFEETVSAMWNLETIGIKPEIIASEQFTENYVKECIGKIDNRYIAALPWKNIKTKLHNNERGAMCRLKSLIRKLSQESKNLKEYDAAMWEYIENGVAEVASAGVSENQRYFMPHRPVYREDRTTTKVRVVFDASAHVEQELSLNDHLHTGSNLLPDVLKLLLNFRIGIIGIVADIEKAFLQILLEPKDRDSHSFYWLSTPISNTQLPSVCAYRMTRVTFGVTCSPFILCATIRKHLQLESRDHPETCKTLLNSFYMDDLVCSVNTDNEALTLYRESVKIMKNASMNLRKWNSNSRILRELFGDNKERPIFQKVLGVNWHIQSDELSIDIATVPEFSPGTKRNVLSALAKIFDPFGFACPFTLSLKLLFQECWRRKLAWDSELPLDLQKDWTNCISGLQYLKEMAMPRCVVNGEDIQLHIFTDASTRAYGAVAYIWTVNNTLDVSSHFLCAKSRLAPLKGKNFEEITLPRLELTAALVGARLCAYLQKSLAIDLKSCHLWTDSQITLCWIKGVNKKWKPFIKSRAEEIRKLTDISYWCHCSGRQNPADLLTRPIKGNALKESAIWLHGPSWLSAAPSEWPKEEATSDEIRLVNLSLAESTNSSSSCSEPILVLERYSNWNRLLRVTSYVIRFCRRLIKKCIPTNEFLTCEEIEAAENYWIRYTQQLEYGSEINALAYKRNIPGSSNIYTLRPMLDNKNILRVSGRLECLEEPFDFIHPIILPKKAYISKLIVEDCHRRTLHAGVNTVLASVRQKYWIIKGRQLIKQVIARCIQCKRIRSQSASQPFAPLPLDRMQQVRAFSTTGIDFAGPLFVKSQGQVSTRVYILLATCASTRAVHLELVSSMSAECCILALRRFIARRGAPHIIYSDNAKTVKRCAIEYKLFEKIIHNENFTAFLCSHRIKWKFIVERAPWWGGFWERIVRIVKDVLKITVGRALLDSEQLQTFLAEAERVINSRPLTYITDDPTDLEPLTPLHFLTDMTSIAQDAAGTDPPVTTSADLRLRWSNRLKCLRQFWKRWKCEYLVQLRSLHHGLQQFSSKLKVGDVVLLEDQTVSRLLWSLARIEEVYPGRDGRIRACLLKLPNGKKYRRPVQLLYPLELDQCKTAGGGCKKLDNPGVYSGNSE